MHTNALAFPLPFLLGFSITKINCLKGFGATQATRSARTLCRQPGQAQATRRVENPIAYITTASEATALVQRYFRKQLDVLAYNVKILFGIFGISKSVPNGRWGTCRHTNIGMSTPSSSISHSEAISSLPCN